MIKKVVTHPLIVTMKNRAILILMLKASPGFDKTDGKGKNSSDQFYVIFKLRVVFRNFYFPGRMLSPLELNN